MRVLMLTTALAALAIAAPANAQTFQGFSAGADSYGLDATASFPDVEVTDIVLSEQHDETSEPVGFSLGYTHAVTENFYLGGRIAFADADQSGSISFIEGQQTEYTLNSVSLVELRGGYAFDTPFGEVMPYAFVGVISRDIDFSQSCGPSWGVVPTRCTPAGGVSGYQRSATINDSAFLFGVGTELAINSWASVDLSYGQATFDETTVNFGADGQAVPQPLSTLFGEQEYSVFRVGVRIRYDLLNRVGGRD